MFTHDLTAMLNFYIYVVMSLMALAMFIKLYVWWTPTDEIACIRQNDIPQAITMAGVSLGFTSPLLACSYLGSGILVFWELALVACVMQLILEKIMSYWLVERNEATSIFHASLSVCMGMIVGFSIIP